MKHLKRMKHTAKGEGKRGKEKGRGGEREYRVPERGGHASTQYETENPCLGSVMLEHRHRKNSVPQGLPIHTQIHNTHHTQHNNTLAHSHTRTVTAAVAALDDITLPGGAAEGASAAYTRKRTQFKWQLRLKRCFEIIFTLFAQFPEKN